METKKEMTQCVRGMYVIHFLVFPEYAFVGV